MIQRVALFLVFLLSASCRREYKNEYYDRAYDLYQKALASPSQTEFLDQLIADASDSDPGRRSYAVGFLGFLGKEKKLASTQHSHLIEVLRKKIGDEDPAIKRKAVIAIRNIGSDAVLVAVSELVNLVESHDENDFTWFAADALGKIRSKDDALRVAPVLLGAACRPRLVSLPNGSPELRIEAASALLELVETNALPLRDALLQLKANLPHRNLRRRLMNC